MENDTKSRKYIFSKKKKKKNKKLKIKQITTTYNKYICKTSIRKTKPSNTALAMNIMKKTNDKQMMMNEMRKKEEKKKQQHTTTHYDTSEHSSKPEMNI